MENSVSYNNQQTMAAECSNDDTKYISSDEYEKSNLFSNAEEEEYAPQAFYATPSYQGNITVQQTDPTLTFLANINDTLTDIRNMMSVIYNHVTTPES